MRRCLLFLLLGGLHCFGQNIQTVFEVDSLGAQTNRPITFGRIFVKGEITAGNCPQVLVGGTAPTQWQADVKNWWDDGSVKFSVISYVKTLASGGSHAITYTSGAACNSGGAFANGMTQAQMLAFNSGGSGWGAELNVNAIPNSFFSTGFENGTIQDYCAPGTFNAGAQEFCSGNNGGNVEITGVGSTTVVASPTHAGTKALKLQVSTPNTPTSGVRMFRWLDPRNSQANYYSVWMNIPQRYTLTGNPATGHYVNLFQFKSANGAGRIDPIWAFHINDDDPSHWYLQAVWGDGGFTAAGPQSGDNVSRKVYTQTTKELPVNRWVHLEAYLEQSNAFGGRLTMWQDGVQIFDFTNVRTSYTNCAYNAWCADDEWSVNLYTDGLTPNPAYLYIDDVSIYNARANAKDMLSALPDPSGSPECGPEYWLKGPVVTQLKLHDCTSAATYDFGFKDKRLTVLSAAITAAATSINLLYPGDVCRLALPTVIDIELEKLNVTACTAGGNPLTVTRGFGGTTAASHAAAKHVVSESQASQLAAAPSSGVVAPHTYKSLHPIFTLSFYPGPNYASSTCSGSDPYCSVKVDFILENIKNTSVQDQVYSFVLKTGLGLATVHSRPSFTHAAYARWRETFWSGTGPGAVRIDPNFAYLKSTKVLPNYDPAVTVNPAADYGTFINAAVSDGGIVGGKCWQSASTSCAGLLVKSMSSNSEGAPIQREELDYLYNSSSCGSPNSDCAKALYMLTGEKGAIDTLLPASLCTAQPGCRYGGTWDALQSAPYHIREGRFGASAPNAFYSSARASKDAGANTAATAAVAGNLVIGRPQSRHAFSEQYGNSTLSPAAGCRAPGALVPVNCATTNGWSVGFNDIPNHLVDYYFLPYILTGDAFYLEGEYFAASVSLLTINPGTGMFQSNGFFGYISPSDVPRNFAWGMQAVSRAAFLAPDGSKESDYYASMLNSGIEVQEGFANLTGTSLTPSDTACAAYNAATANRWCWGRKTVAQDAIVKNRAPNVGACMSSSSDIDITKSNQATGGYLANFLVLAVNQISELGFTQANAIRDEYNKRITEMVMDATFNPYLVAAVRTPVKDASATCPASPMLANLAAVKDAFVPTVQVINNFCSGGQTCNGMTNPAALWGFKCTDHDYPLIARATAAYAAQNSTSITNANCPGGICLGIAAFAWLDAEVPYFSKNSTVSGTCGTSDVQIKFALQPRTAIVGGNSTAIKGVTITGKAAIR